MDVTKQNEPHLNCEDFEFHANNGSNVKVDQNILSGVIERYSDTLIHPRLPSVTTGYVIV